MFTTIDHVAAFLQLDIEEIDPSIERAIAEATEVIRNYCRQYLSYIEDELTLVYGNGSRLLSLPELPIVNIDEITIGGSEVGYRVNYNTGLVLLDRCLGVFEPATVIYSHGYEQLPDDIIAVATRAASRTYQAGLKSQTQGGIIGLQAVSIGDYSETYGGDSATEGQLGVSGSRMLLLSEKDILNRYRLKGA